MSLRKLIMILSTTALLAGAGVAGAFASSPAHVTSGGATATTTCTGEDDQGENEQGDEESDAATEVEQAAAKVDQEAGRQQADDQSGDDQQGDDQDENDDCDG
jgi:nucleosome binding factor SPN SPT16 subunit